MTIKDLKIRIRNACPDDGPFLAGTILMAGRAHVSKGIWEVILGGTEEECLDFLQYVSITEIPHLFHYSCYYVAENENGPIGSLGGYDPRISGYQALQQAIPEVARRLELPAHTYREAGERSLRMLACLPEEVEGAWIIDSVATLPEYRGRGVAGSLLERVLAVGREQGHEVAQINMYIGNEPALRLYLKFGFEIIEEKRSEYFEQEIGSPGMLSLALKL